MVLRDQETKVKLVWVCAFSPEYLELVSSQGEESLEHVRQEGLYHLVLLDGERDTARVHRCLDIAHLCLVTSDCNWVQQKFCRFCELDLGV